MRYRDHFLPCFSDYTLNAMRNFDTTLEDSHKRMGIYTKQNICYCEIKNPVVPEMLKKFRYKGVLYTLEGEVTGKEDTGIALYKSCSSMKQV